MLYGWPLAVWENMRWVRGTRGWEEEEEEGGRVGGEGRGEVGRLGRGGSFMPRIMCAGERVG
jgi:hypothetical protein